MKNISLQYLITYSNYPKLYIIDNIEKDKKFIVRFFTKTTKSIENMERNQNPKLRKEIRERDR